VAILIYAGDRDVSMWVEALRAEDSNIDIRVYPYIGELRDIRFALTWPYPHGFWNKFPNLKAISSIGAGVSHILSDNSLSKDIPVLKLIDKRLNQSMWEYILSTVSYHAMRLHNYQEQQSKKEWKEIPPRSFDATTIGIMGLGSIGLFVAKNLASLGFVIKGFANSSKNIQGIKVYTPSQTSEELIATVDIWVSILPLTEQTNGMFNSKFFLKLKRGATFINVGRGPQVVERDIIDALDNGSLEAAYLDVFDQEPLPQEHPFWTHPKINITPHIASITDPKSVASQIVLNYRSAIEGLSLDNVVDRELGY